MFAPKNSSIIFTQHVFPVYMYDPVKVRIEDISSAVWCMLATFLVVVCWGTVASIYFSPVNFGVSIIGLALILLQLFLAHATTQSPIQLAKSLRCSRGKHNSCARCEQSRFPLDVCMHVCVLHTNMRTHIHTCVHTCCSHTYFHTYIHAYMHTCSCTCMHTWSYIHNISMHTCVYTHIHTCSYACSHNT